VDGVLGVPVASISLFKNRNLPEEQVFSMINQRVTSTRLAPDQTAKPGRGEGHQVFS
jgi:hypothetical protein